ncbi:hypothetical protein CPC08DRAFT_690360 [Agrocybe pediades]|nr:hypothetical protein CPC08DRAFT_690360 [Agrocybe pediades]
MPVSDWSADTGGGKGKEEDAEVGFPDPEVPSWAAEPFVPPSGKGKEKTKEGEDEEMGWPEPELPDWAKEPFKPSEGKDKDKDQDEEMDWSKLPVKTWAHDSNEEKKDKGKEKEKEPETLEEMLERAGAAWEPLKVGDFTWDPAEELSKDDDGMNWGNIWEESQRAKAPELQCPTHGSTCKRGICRDLDRVYREQERNKSGKKFEGGSGSMSRKKSTESFESRSSKPAWADPFPIKYDENGNVKPRKKVRRGGKNKKKKDKDPMVMGHMRGFSDEEDGDPTDDDRPPKEPNTKPPSKRAEKRERRAAREEEEGGGSSRNEGEDGAEGSDRGQRPHHADITNDWGVDAGGEIKNDWGGEDWD